MKKRNKPKIVVLGQGYFSNYIEGHYIHSFYKSKCEKSGPVWISLKQFRGKKVRLIAEVLDEK